MRECKVLGGGPGGGWPRGTEIRGVLANYGEGTS